MQFVDTVLYIISMKKSDVIKEKKCRYITRKILFFGEIVLETIKYKWENR